MEHYATYSPEDNKLRLYPAYRLDKDDYYRFKKAGFKWAPKQELFVAPMWTPDREDLLIEFCGEVGDEDTSLIDRAEERAERFGGYSEKRLNDAETAKKQVDAITSGIPLGQPILVGHHSEKRARKDAERIENGMRKAVKMWETSKYWEQRARGAIRHAKYKERPDVRARRIKKIEADKRKQERIKKEAKGFLNIWLHPSILTKSRALYIANYSYISFKFPLNEYPRQPPASQYEGDMSLWSALSDDIITAKQARNLHVPILERTISYNERWIGHFENRLLYEKTMLEGQGASDLLKPKPRPKQPPLLNYRAPGGIKVENMYHKGEFSIYPQIEMTKKEYMSNWKDNRGTATIENSHRVRVLYKMGGGQLSRSVVFLTDSKAHTKPEPQEPESLQMPKVRTQHVYKKPEQTEFDVMKDTLREGIKIVSAPQLFPTPPEIAQRMVELAEIEPDHKVLEPSAGTGNILKAIGNQPDKTAVEINHDLVDMLARLGVSGLRVYCADFLECNGDLGEFDRILMNPPFKNGEDIKHILHAIDFLKPGGKLVALCANGPRQNDKLKPIADMWEDLPPDTFKEAGTRVNSALLIINKEA